MLQKLIKIISILFFILCMTSCYTYRNTGFLQDRSLMTEYNKVDYKEYRIRINDEILYRLVTVNEEISDLIAPNTNSSVNIVSYRVHPDGTIDIPFVNSIQVEGLTLEDAEKVVQNKVREIIPDAVVKLTLSNKTFTVIGEINSGIYPIYKEQMTIFQALALSNSIQPEGDRKHVKIIRETNEGVKVLEFDIRPSSIIGSEYYYVYPNDIIYVQKSKSSFYKTQNYTSFLSLVTSSITLFLTVLYYSNLSK